MSVTAAAAPSTDAIHYEIVTPSGRVASGSCDMVVAPAIHGEIGILKNHAPFLASLSTGVLRIKHGEISDRVFISNGFIEVLENKVIILAEIAERGETIDAARAKEALGRAEKRLEIGNAHALAAEHIDRTRARRALDKARERLKAAEHGTP